MIQYRKQGWRPNSPYKRWSKEEDRIILEAGEEALRVEIGSVYRFWETIADKLHRSVNACRVRHSRLIRRQEKREAKHPRPIPGR